MLYTRDWSMYIKNRTPETLFHWYYKSSNFTQGCLWWLLLTTTRMVSRIAGAQCVMQLYDNTRLPLNNILIMKTKINNAYNKVWITHHTTANTIEFVLQKSQTIGSLYGNTLISTHNYITVKNKRTLSDILVPRLGFQGNKTTHASRKV